MLPDNPFATVSTDNDQPKEVSENPENNPFNSNLEQNIQQPDINLEGAVTMQQQGMLPPNFQNATPMMPQPQQNPMTPPQPNPAPQMPQQNQAPAMPQMPQMPQIPNQAPMMPPMPQVPNQMPPQPMMPQQNQSPMMSPQPMMPQQNQAPMMPPQPMMPQQNSVPAGFNQQMAAPAYQQTQYNQPQFNQQQPNYNNGYNQQNNQQRKYKIIDMYWLINNKYFMDGKSWESGECQFITIGYNASFNNMRFTLFNINPNMVKESAITLQNCQKVTTINLFSEGVYSILAAKEKGIHVKPQERVFTTNNFMPNETIWIWNPDHVMLYTQDSNKNAHAFTFLGHHINILSDCFNWMINGNAWNCALMACE